MKHKDWEFDKVYEDKKSGFYISIRKDEESGSVVLDILTEESLSIVPIASNHIKLWFGDKGYTNN
jgi:hypothetical protein